MCVKTRPYFTVMLIFMGLLNTVSAQTNPKPQKIKTIIIDAGHGGTDVGARGAYSTEAQITLQLALRLDTLLRSEMPDTRFVMTRTTDIYHHVREKADIANNEKGDLFVCIHVNAAPPKKQLQVISRCLITKGKEANVKSYTRKSQFTAPPPTQHTELQLIYGRPTDQMRKHKELLQMKDMNRLQRSWMFQM